MRERGVATATATQHICTSKAVVGRPSPGSAVKVVPRDGRPGYTLSQASGAGGHGELPSVEDDARSLRGDSRWLGRVVV